MITINFLPVAAMRRRFKSRAFRAAYGLYLVLTVAVMVGVKFGLLGPSLEKLADEKKQAITSLGEVSQEVTRTSAAASDAVNSWKQLAAIVELEERRRDQTRLLLEVEELLPESKAWLVGLSHGDGLLSLEGISTDKETVSQFLTRLENAAYVIRDSIILVQISQDMVINGIKLTKFSINAKTSFPQPEVLDNGLPEFGLPKREDFAKAVKAVDEKLAADLTAGPEAAKKGI